MALERLEMNQNTPLCKHIQSLSGYVQLVFWLLKPLYKSYEGCALWISHYSIAKFLITKQP